MFCLSVISSENVDAEAGYDYTTINQRITFNRNERCKSQEVKIKGDTLLEMEESFKLSLSDAIAGEVSDIQSTATVNIKDDDCKY